MRPDSNSPTSGEKNWEEVSGEVGDGENDEKNDAGVSCFFFFAGGGCMILYVELWARKRVSGFKQRAKRILSFEGSIVYHIQGRKFKRLINAENKWLNNRTCIINITSPRSHVVGTMSKLLT